MEREAQAMEADVQVPAILEGTPHGPTATALEVERYDRGFSGVASEPFSEQARAVLAEPINPDQVEVRPDGIVYLPWVWYADRLNRAFGAGAWSIVPRDRPQRIGDTVVYNGALYVLGRFVREAWGECEYRANNPTMSYASALEGAQSDCVVRCCKVLGVAKELWDPGWRDGFMASHVVKAWLPEDGRRRAQWIFWRKDRETPWQVTKAKVSPQPAGVVKAPLLNQKANAKWTAPGAPTATEMVIDHPQPSAPFVDQRKVPPVADDRITEDQKRALEGAITKCAKAAGVDPKGFREEVKNQCGRTYGVEHFAELTPAAYEQVMAGLRAAYVEAQRQAKP